MTFKYLYRVRFEFKNGLSVTIETETLEGVIDAYLVGLAVLEKTTELGYTKPKMKTHHFVSDSERGKVSSQENSLPNNRENKREWESIISTR